MTQPGTTRPRFYHRVGGWPPDIPSNPAGYALAARRWRIALRRRFIPLELKRYG